MSFGADCLIQKINDRIAALEGCTYNAAQVSGSLNSIETYHCVPDLASLPAAACNEGRFIYVEDIKSFRYSDGYYWTKDACSVLGDVNTSSTLWTWGNNCSGSLGDGTTINRCSPGTVLGGGNTWISVSAGNYHTSAIKTDGTIWSWGRNCDGAFGDGTTVCRCSPGTIWGNYTTWKQVSNGNRVTAAIKCDGTLWTWGSGNFGILGNGTTVARCSPGTIAGGGTWCKVQLEATTAVALKTDGTLWTWGINSAGTLGDGTTVDRCSPGTVAGGGTTWCHISTSAQSNIFGIKTDGTLWTWGCNTCGELGDGTTISRCSPGTIFGGGITWCQSGITGIRNLCNSAAAIKTDGTLWTWGSNVSGLLGDGTTIDRCSPGTVAGGGTNWCFVEGINSPAFAAIKTDGTLWTWGNSAAGILGNGNALVNRCSPGTVAGGGNTWYFIEGSNNANWFVALKSRGF